MKVVIYGFTMVFFFVSFLFSQAIDFSTDRPITILKESEKNDRLFIPEGPRQGAVLWDTTHGVYLNYQPFFRYTDLVDILADSGFTMECCGTGVHTVNLSLYDIIVIAVGSSWYSTYTQEEVDSLVSFYNQGHQRVVVHEARMVLHARHRLRAARLLLQRSSVVGTFLHPAVPQSTRATSSAH